MSEILSQDEIDKLLNAYSTGELDTEALKDEDTVDVKVYDFSRPSKFSKEHLRTLESIFEHYGRLLYTNLPAYLRKSVQVDVMNAEAVTYSEFSNSLSNPVLLGLVNFSPLPGNILVELATNLGYCIIDRLLGGEGVALEKKREFSEIELTIVERVLNVCVDLLRDPWKNVANVQPRLERIETNSQFAQIISPQEMTAIVTINLKIGDVEGLMNICLPYATLEDVIDKLNIKFWYSTMQSRDDGTNYDGIIETLISKAEIPIKAILGESSMSVAEFVNLQPGDLIKLDSDIEQELTVYVGNIKKFMALPGSSNDNYAIRITSVIREE
ncbi:MAG: flagellar motor switch protein FliM [Lachnospiraceae bacterium]|nr:flagellar motor switch protein FliM [Lachnospiraceae bacterium]MCI8825092.1 flagellar motor switch protein FliM [Lachnospiraceae bacterium]MCI9370705.1 flagellar motor switch protein FliM [Lachnospiraceae bacterium]MDE7307687.1 flagellar motor switch protein FliM [Lachnospiraceae bacterium]